MSRFLNRIEKGLKAALGRPKTTSTRPRRQAVNVLHLFGGGFEGDTSFPKDPVSRTQEDQQALLDQEKPPAAGIRLRECYPDYSQVQAREGRLREENPRYFSHRAIQAGLKENWKREEWQRFLKPPQ